MEEIRHIDCEPQTQLSATEIAETAADLISLGSADTLTDSLRYCVLGLQDCFTLCDRMPENVADDVLSDLPFSQLETVLLRFAWTRRGPPQDNFGSEFPYASLIRERIRVWIEDPEAKNFQRFRKNLVHAARAL